MNICYFVAMNVCYDSKLAPSLYRLVKTLTFAAGDNNNILLSSCSLLQCKHVNGSGFRVGSYQCVCRKCADCSPVDGITLYDTTGVDEPKNVTAYFSQYCSASHVSDL